MTVPDQAGSASPSIGDAHLPIPSSTAPMLSQATCASHRNCDQAYQDIVAGGGWPVVPPGANCGSVEPARVVVSARASCRLRRSRPERGVIAVFDFVRRGRRCSISRPVTGLTDGHCYARYVLGFERAGRRRLRQLEINLVRLRALSGNLGERLRDRQHSGGARSRPSRTAWSDPSHRRRRQDRPSVAGHDDRRRSRSISIRIGRCRLR